MSRFIKKFSIEIGQPAIMGVPLGEAFIQFIINDSTTTCRLNDLKDWINEIANSKGDRNEKAYKAKRNLDELFNNILAPFFILPENPKNE